MTRHRRSSLRAGTTLVRVRDKTNSVEPGDRLIRAGANDIEDVVTVRKTQLAADWAKRLAPATTVARAQLSGSDFVIVEKSTHRTVPAKGPTCFIPESLDSWSRRLIAVQTCGKAYVVPALYVARAPYGMPAPVAVGHCGHQSLHQPSSSLGLPVSAWYTPTSC